jgi:FkbM family methyltransferase
MSANSVTQIPQPRFASIRRWVPSPIRRVLRAGRSAAVDAIAVALQRSFAWSPDRARTKALEKLNGPEALVRPLDYAGGSIVLGVSSVVELATRLRSCAKEPETVAWIEEHVQPGNVLYDIGANVGAYSLVAASHSGGAAKVYAFEPSATTFAQLCRNIALNGCIDCVTPFPVAFGAETAVLSFNYASLEAGAALHAVGAAVDSRGEPFTPVFAQPILVYDMDGFIETFGLETPTHIKIDVDGTELAILQGAQRTLANLRLRTVMIELDWGTPQADAAKAVIESAGFQLAMRKSHDTEQGIANCLFIRK